MRPFAKWRLALICALLVGCAALVAACGGSSDSSSSSAGGGDATTSAEATTTSNDGGSGEVAGVPAPVTEPPTEFPIKTRLKEPPPKQNLTWLACSLPICQEALSEGYHEAAGALGWPIKQINYDTLKAADAVQTALNENPDFIAITGIPVAAYEPQAKEAMKKGIPILSGNDTTPPEPKTNGLYYQYGPAGVELEGEEIAKWMVHDSEGKAKAVTLTIGEYPILTAEIEGIERVFAKCPECSLGTLSVTAEEVGEGKVPSKLVAYLQSNPDTGYVEYTFSDLSTGAQAALKGAGLADKVKQTGVNASAAVIKEITKGEQAAWTMQPTKYADWLTLDVASRLTLGMPLEPYEKEGNMPTWVVDTPEAAEGLLNESEGLWNGPEGFEEKFKELWGVK